MPVAKALSFASCFALTIQFLIFAYLYSSHRVRFFRYLVVVWGLMSLAKGLHLAETLVPGQDIAGALINAVFFGATLLVLAAGLAFRSGYRIGWRDLLLGGAGALVATSLGDVSDAGLAVRSIAGVATGATLILADFQFWPRPAQPRYRGSRFLATALSLWGVHRIVAPFFDPEPGSATHVTVHMGFMFFYFLSTFAIIIMVLDRARSETATLKEFNERLVDGLGEGLQLVDGDFQVRHANRWMHEQFGRVVGRRCYEVLTDDGARCPACPLDRRHQMRDAERIEVAGRDGRRFSLSCAPVRQPDGQIFLLELVADVTERDRLQARLTEAERLAAAGELAAGVAHEIRNPLAAIVNATTLLGSEESLTREERASTLSAVKKEARRLNRILSDFLVFARPREPKRLPADIREVVDHVSALIREDPGRARRVDVEVHVDPDVPSFAFDADQMSQVVWNIALNGVEAIAGRGRLSIRVGLRAATVAIVIRDTGRGISTDEGRHVFEPFYSRKQGGTGLGLTIARRIVPRTAGGSRSSRRPVRARSSPFSFRCRTASSMATILIVDDESSARTTLALLLSKRSHRVIQAEGVVRALKTLTEEVFEVIVTDLRMPDGDGLDVLRAAKTHCPEADVILLTAYAGWESAKEAIQLGAVDYFEKGREPDELLHRIDRALEEKALRRENANLRAQVRDRYGLPGLLAASPQMASVVDLVRRVAPTDATVLIQGESGKGQGSHRQGDPSCKRAGPRAVRRHQLRGAARDVAGVGDLRARQGRLHGRKREQEGALRGGSPRDAPPRRDRRDGGEPSG